MRKRARPWRGVMTESMPSTTFPPGTNAPRAAGRSPKRENAYFSVRYAGEFLGFFHIMDRAGHVELGVGMKPELCGQGRGRMLMALALAKILETRGCTTVMLAVRTFNTRAGRCFERAGVMKLSAPRPEKCTSCRPQFDLSQTSSPSLGSLMRGGLFLFMHKINKK